MKKLEDFECKKVELKTTYGGRIATCPDTCTIVRCSDGSQYGQGDGQDC